MDKILKNAKLLILPSFFEGFPYVIVEALSNGVPCLVANTFNNASYLVSEARGECINNFDVDYWVKKIKFFQNLDIEEYLNYSKNALNFAKENLTKNKFKDFWIKLIKEI